MSLAVQKAEVQELVARVSGLSVLQARCVLRILLALLAPNSRMLWAFGRAIAYAVAEHPNPDPVEDF